MSIKILLVPLLFLFTFKGYPAFSDLTCSKGGTYIVFINGVNVDDLKFREFRKNVEAFALRLELRKVDNKNMSFGAFHNSSVNLLVDVGETYFEFLKSMGIKNPSSSERYLEILMATYIGDYSSLSPFNDLEFLSKKAFEILVSSHQKLIDEDIEELYSTVAKELKKKITGYLYFSFRRGNYY